MLLRLFLFSSVAVFSLGLVGCGGGDSPDAGGEADGDTDVDADVDGDVDTDTGTGSDTTPSELLDVLFINEVQVGDIVVKDGTPTSPDALAEIFNAGTEPVTLGRTNLCTVPSYWTVGATVVIPAGGFLTVHWDEGTNTGTDVFSAMRSPGDSEHLLHLDPASGELALYDTNNAFGPLDDGHLHIVDYVRWGAPPEDKSRAEVADSAGIWTEGDSVDVTGWAPTQSIGRTSLDHSVDAWAMGDPTFGEAN